MDGESRSLVPEWPYAWGRPDGMGAIRTRPEDFRVDEDLGFSPSGQGQHVLLRIEKRETNTDWIARQLARFANVPLKAVGYGGLKDRHALTTQWFSVDLAGRSEPAWVEFRSETYRVLEAARHTRKLRRGALRGNRFQLVVRELSGVDEQDLARRADAIARHGVPNYFGEQRFGRFGSNLERALALFEKRGKGCDRHKRGLYLSAARSWLFNHVLAARVQSGSWNEALPGEALILNGSRAHFTAEAVDADILRRLEEGDVHPSGPLWGRGDLASKGAAAEAETGPLSALEPFLVGLEAAGLRQERRALRVLPLELRSSLTEGVLVLSFWLPSGTYATSLLREIVCLQAPEGVRGRAG